MPEITCEASLAYYLILSQAEIAGVKTTTVATEFSLRLLGPIGAAAASAAVMCSVFGALNGNLMVGPRLLYAMGQDNLAPKALAAVHPQYKTPAMATVVLAIWSCLHRMQTRRRPCANRRTPTRACSSGLSRPTHDSCSTMV